MNILEILQTFWRIIILALYGISPTTLPIIQAPITVVNQAKPDPPFNWTAFAAVVALISLLITLFYNIFNERRKLLIAERERRIELLREMMRKSGVFFNDLYKLANDYEGVPPDVDIDNDGFTTATFSKIGDLVADGYSYGPLIVSDNFSLLGTYFDEHLLPLYRKAMQSDTSQISNTGRASQKIMTNELHAIAEEKADLTAHLFRLYPRNSFQAASRKQKFKDRKRYNESRLAFLNLEKIVRSEQKDDVTEQELRKKL